MCFSLNKSTSYLSLCLSLNSFCNETSRTWTSLSPETRCVISVKRTWVQVPIWVAPFHYHMDEPWKHYGQEEARHKRIHIVWVPLYEVSRMDKSIETESRFMVARAGRRQEWGITVTWKLGSPLGGCQTKRHNQAKEWEKEGFLITCSK